ncbi:MAG: deoxyribose-phosphate aldolase [Clostridia bacterium]|nr:deoxyribose-phosphate aldolase [Clostridia bacterium]
MIDHSLLQPQMTRDEIEEGCSIAEAYHTASVCVRGYDVEYCAKRLQGTDVMVSAVTGFPHGNCTIDDKVYESEKAIANGANEIDMVMAIGMVRSGEYDYESREVEAVLNVCRKHNAALKVIFENAYLSSTQIVACCRICDALNVDFVKTSTGYAPSGAKLEDVRLMRASVKPTIQIKAAGGIRTLDEFLEFFNAGVTRQGTRSTEAIVKEAVRRGM